MEPLSNLRPDGHPMGALAALAEDEAGVTAIEYALVAALIALACLSAMTGFADALNTLYQTWVAAAMAAIVGALGG